MPASALVDLLPDFAASRAPAPRLAAVPSVPLEPARPAPVDIEARLAAERSRIEEAVTARLAAGHEAALAAERERHAEALAATERRLGEEAAALLSSRLAEMEGSLHARLAAPAARILAAFASERMVERSLAKLAEAIGEALADAEAVKVRVTGPASLFDALAARMGDKAAMLGHREADTIDLAVEIDDSIVETRLDAWQAMLNEVLA